MQKQGTLQLPNKVAYGIAKNLKKANEVGADYEKYRGELLQFHVEQDNKGGFGTVQVGNQLEYQFKSDKDRDEYLSKVEAYMDAEIDFGGFKINSDDIKMVHNMPVDTLMMLEDFELITDIAIESNLKIIN